MGRYSRAFQAWSQQLHAHRKTVIVAFVGIALINLIAMNALETVSFVGYKANARSLRSASEGVKTDVEGNLDELQPSVNKVESDGDENADKLRNGVGGKFDELPPHVNSDFSSIFGKLHSVVKEANQNMTSTLMATMVKLASNIVQQVAEIKHNMGQASHKEVEYIAEDAPFLSSSFLGNDQPTCGAANIVPPAIDYLPEGNDDLLDLIRQDTTLRGHPVVGATHCITKLVGPAQAHYLTQVPFADAHPTIFSAYAYSPRPLHHGPRKVEVDAKRAVVLAFLPKLDFFCAVPVRDDTPALRGSSTVLFARWVHTLSVYTAHARKAATLAKSNLNVQWRTALLFGQSIWPSNPMTLWIAANEVLHEFGDDITLPRKQLSPAGVASVEPAKLSAAENRSIEATLSQYADKKYDYDAAAIVSTLVYTPARTPQGMTGGPVYVFKHNYTTGAMEVYQGGLYLGFNSDFEQMLVAPLWPTVGPMEELLRVAIAVQSWPVPQWRDCPLHRRALQLGRAGAVDLSADIEAQVRRIVHTAAACVPE